MTPVEVTLHRRDDLGAPLDMPVCIVSRGEDGVLLDLADAMRIGAGLVTLAWSALLEDIARDVADALGTDGAHHKQWYLERLGRLIGMDLSRVEHEEGIAP